MNQHYIKAVHARASRGHEQILFFLFALTILCWNAAAWAAPAAGTQIGNQASATYTIPRPHAP
jgi:hypothetical protein